MSMAMVSASSVASASRSSSVRPLDADVRPPGARIAAMMRSRPPERSAAGTRASMAALLRLALPALFEAGINELLASSLFTATMSSFSWLELVPFASPFSRSLASPLAERSLCGNVIANAFLLTLGAACGRGVTVSSGGGPLSSSAASRPLLGPSSLLAASS